MNTISPNAEPLHFISKGTWSGTDNSCCDDCHASIFQYNRFHWDWTKLHNRCSHVFQTAIWPVMLHSTQRYKSYHTLYVIPIYIFAILSLSMLLRYCTVFCNAIFIHFMTNDLSMNYWCPNIICSSHAKDIKNYCISDNDMKCLMEVT